VRLKNIPAGATLGTLVVSDGPVEILLLDAADYARFPSPRSPLSRARTADRIEVSVRAPSQGDYYVLVDNRQGSEERSVSVTVTGEAHSPAGGTKAEAKLRDFGARMAGLFVFEPFPIRLASCAETDAVADESEVVLCTESVLRLRERLGDSEQLSDALLFAVLHGVGRVLLAQWEHPMFASRPVDDEFATAVMAMLGQGERLRDLARRFSTDGPPVGGESVRPGDDGALLSQERARRILEHLDDPELLRRWQRVFVPHLQTPVLERLKQQPTVWADAGLIERELAARD
jgi:hypothetical protein